MGALYCQWKHTMLLPVRLHNFLQRQPFLLAHAVASVFVKPHVHLSDWTIEMPIPSELLKLSRIQTCIVVLICCVPSLIQRPKLGAAVVHKLPHGLRQLSPHAFQCKEFAHGHGAIFVRVKKSVHSPQIVVHPFFFFGLFLTECFFSNYSLPFADSWSSQILFGNPPHILSAFIIIRRWQTEAAFLVSFNKLFETEFSVTVGVNV
mmetsp:Transcript_113275/g.212223  ORF Transcript_113275/g.212223 Transcript_113275/m.212223 type:complete len:205 (-) Transcript_113275:1244-1858(-)